MASQVFARERGEAVDSQDKDLVSVRESVNIKYAASIPCFINDHVVAGSTVRSGKQFDATVRFLGVDDALRFSPHSGANCRFVTWPTMSPIGDTVLFLRK